MFRPLAVSRRQFIELLSTAWIDDFAAGTSLMLENISPIGDRLSLLLNGRYAKAKPFIQAVGILALAAISAYFQIMPRCFCLVAFLSLIDCKT